MSRSDQVPTNSGFSGRSTGDEVLAGIDLTGRTAIVTGGYSGLGLETTRALARAGARVVVAVRTPDKARDSLADIEGQVETAPLDLSELPSVRAFADQMQAENLDTIFCANTLQQIGPDFLVLRNFHKMLQSGGQCVLIVPNDLRLFGPIDTALGHQRRYERKQLSQLMERAGFEVVEQRGFNKIGAAGWRTLGLGLGQRRFGSLTAIAMDKIWSVSKYLDPILPGPAMSMMIVGRKP